MFSYKLSWKEYALLAIIIILDYLYVRIDQIFIPEKFRALAFALVLIISLLIFFFFVKPEQPYRLSRFLSFWLGVIVLIIMVITHVIITFDLSVKGLVILTLTIGIPWLAGVLYKTITKNKTRC
ncbi:MAG TPA: hypothetical protein PLP19_04455 [bacterium]|nr:hypothetical protein [bacterium]HPN42722.1 hypothetical protein [bacterium]